jgi:uncharacterized membrane protein YvlD (DUF360 family)
MSTVSIQLTHMRPSIWQTIAMDGAAGIALKFAIRVLVFGLVFLVVSRKRTDITVHKRWAILVVALIFAALNTALYFALKPILDVITLEMLSYAMPLLINIALLAVTLRIVESRKWLAMDSITSWLVLGAALTLAHGALWLGLDYLPTKF